MNKYKYLLLTIAVISIFSSCKEEPIDIDEDGITCRNLPAEDFASCVVNPDTTTLDVATWNMEFFPQQGENTIDAVQKIVNSFNADIIAVQEISSPADLEEVTNVLADWEVQVINNGNLSLGFLYNTCEITSVTEVKLLDIGGSSPFPRNPVQIDITHKNGIEATLINIHLKCCDDGYDRRILASELLKNYIDEEYPQDNVILLGDFNDDIKDSNSPFNNFIEDAENYSFTDMAIAQGGTANYSYPSWPSHIDHILVTNELFNEVNTTGTVNFEACSANYSSVVSDHRPVMVSLSN